MLITARCGPAARPGSLRRVTNPEAPGSPAVPLPVPSNSWKTLGTRVMYANPWITVREDDVIRPDGKPGIYGVVEMRLSVGIVALNDAGVIALASQWPSTLPKPPLTLPTVAAHP